MTHLCTFSPSHWHVARSVKVLCLVLTMGVYSSVQAQGTGAPVYEMILGTGNMDRATKPVLSALLNSFPGSEIEFLREPTHLLISPPYPLSYGQMGAALEVAGMRLITLRDTANGPAPLPAAEPFPVYPDTGNPDQDAATYDTEKSRWIDRYPEAYEQLILSAPCDTP